jgi:hypothetical protein
MRRQLTPTRAQAANMWRLAAGLVGLPGRREMPERGQLCGDCSQAGAAPLGGDYRAKRFASATTTPGSDLRPPHRRFWHYVVIFDEANFGF